ncbi:hypothetical protein HZ989_12125 [Brevundimonas sp. AJA228-03]|uniref:DUF5677 domain-containing protein n=1 Tax=Brevundimonas sp. AJA228-03 TaxID=2752515 RepID=UPI001ADEECAE|nr:DUF5677 domain-containing protein [Brevundimonas sp. AJA228-03]QTN18973.1 hypothetical protein HZ989_12125 [Brevundimonas sp. AJA228-03]
MTKFVEMGFASDETRESIADLISTNAEWFGLLNEVIRSLQITAIKACDTVKGSPFDKLPLSLLVLHRANGHLQGAAILLERGMVVEARTLLRSFLETALVMAGLHDNYETVKAMLIEDMDAAKKGQAKVIMKHGIAHDIEKLEERIKEFGRVQNLSIDKLAEQGPLNRMYLLYRVISNDAAHPSGRSLRRHMRIADDGSSWNGYLIGPNDPADVAETADQLIMTGIALGVAFQQMVEDVENNEKLGEIAERYYPVRDAHEKAKQVICK